MFRGGNKVRVSDSVLRKVRLAADFVGCTVEEFIERSLDREAQKALLLTNPREPLPQSKVQPRTTP